MGTPVLNLCKRHRDRMTDVVSSTHTSSVGNSCVGIADALSAPNTTAPVLQDHDYC
ncbi:Hypothetical protein SMAX5B_021326 [Scophthalmus maximus]|uniref:Uncharacterized protein n=1 Tax=Scophthalmus maximus TaxID=52904 RepID=A0A2U9B3B7_SCOMX|nr:Hypothetical protein SMAX5B_021326 [Scophthalmus maximus]